MRFEAKANRSLKHDHEIVIVSSLITAIFLLINIYPIIFVLITSIKKTEELYMNIWSFPKTIELGNYSFAWISGHLKDYFSNSLFVVFLTVFFILLLGSLAGYALARLKVPFPKAIMLLILSTMLLPSEAVLMPMYLMVSKIKMAGTYVSLIVPYIGWGLPLTIYVYRNFFKSLPNELLETGRIDGCTEVKVFLKVAAPLMIPATAANAVFSFTGWWGELIWSSVSLSTTSMKTLPTGILTFMGQNGTNWGPYSAAIIITMIPLIVLFTFSQKYFIEGVTVGAVKG